MHGRAGLVLGIVFALPGPLAGQGDRNVTANVLADTVALSLMHATINGVDGVTIAGQSFYSSASDLAGGDLAELGIAPSGFVRIATNPSADSVWVSPVVEGVRQASRTVESMFQAPSTPGRYEYFVSAQWAMHPDGSRPPSGFAYRGVWALRLIVR